MSKKFLALAISAAVLSLPGSQSFVAVLAFSATFQPATVPAQPAGEIKILNLQGTIEIQTPDGKGVVVKPGDPLPKIPAGSRIRVLSGNVVVQAGKTAVTANSGAWFNLNTAAKDNKVEVTVSVQKGSVPVKAEVSGNVVTVSEGATVNVTIGPKGEISVAATGASVTVQKKDGTTVKVAAGLTMTVAAPPSEPAPAPAPSEKPAAKEEAPAEEASSPPPQDLTKEQSEGEESGAGTTVSPSSP